MTGQPGDFDSTEAVVRTDAVAASQTAVTGGDPPAAADGVTALLAALEGKRPDPTGKRRELRNFLILAAVLLVVFPLTMGAFRLNLVGKYLTYAFVALGLVVCWGHAGILSLGQGVFFGLGGYCMAMFLKLEASDPISTKIQSTPGIPDFMDWNQLTALPKLWIPFKSLFFTMVAVPLIPAVLALIIGTAMFKRRVGGVYFAIITQAIAAILSILIVGQQGYTGGVNGITDLKTLHGWDIQSDKAKLILYFVNAALLLAAVFVSRRLLASKLGRLLLALRDKEERVRFSGYDVANLKTFSFVYAAVLAAVGGAMFTLQVGFMSPSFVGIVPSIEMVISSAVGGRDSLMGAVYGTLVVNFGKTFFSERFPQLWLFLIGALFIAVVMIFPNGLAGMHLRQVKARVAKLRQRVERRGTGSDSAGLPPGLSSAAMGTEHLS
jgi:urea transport system permease protein